MNECVGWVMNAGVVMNAKVREMSMNECVEGVMNAGVVMNAKINQKEIGCKPGKMQVEPPRMTVEPHGMSVEELAERCQALLQQG